MLMSFVLAVALQNAESLIGQLRSDKPEERGAAAQKLKEMGKAALPALEKASREAGRDVADQAKYLLKAILIRENLSPEIFEAMPELEGQLIRGEWTAALMETLRPGKDGQPLHRALKKKDLEALAGPVVAGAKDPYLRQVAIRLVADLQLRGAVPTVATLLEDRDPVLRSMALAVIGELGAREHARAVAALLKDGDPKVCVDAIEALRKLQGREAVAEFVSLLGDLRPQVRGSAMTALQRLGAKETGPAIAALLKDPDLYVRASAAMVLGEFGATDQGEGIAPLLEDRDPGVRRAAAWALGALVAKKSVPALVKLLDDPEPQVRSRAAEALANLNVKEPRLIELLDDADEAVRFRVAWSLGELGMADAVPRLRKSIPGNDAAGLALGRLGATEAIPELVKAAQSKFRPGNRWLAIMALGELGGAAELREMLSDPDALVRSEAAQSLGRLGEAGEFEKLLQDGELRVRYWAGLALARQGKREGVATVLAAAPKVQGGCLFWLNRLRAPEVWKRLEATMLDEALEGRAEEILEKLARKAGLKLEIGLALHRQVFRIPAGTNLACAFDRAQVWLTSEYIMDAMPTRVRFEMVLDSDTLRVVSRRAALEVWKVWAGDNK